MYALIAAAIANWPMLAAAFVGFAIGALYALMGA
jgi:hypothetical protein